MKPNPFANRLPGELMAMKRILILLLSLLAAVGGQAQGCIKGIVTDAKTGGPLPFVSVVILKDGKQVHNGTTDWDGVFVIKPLDTVGTYNIAIDRPGYIRYRREGIRVLPDGFTFVEIKLNRLDNIWLDTITIVHENYGSKDGAMLAPLPEYNIVSRELKRLLDRVIDGKCNTYDHKVKPRRIKRGEYCDLRIFFAQSIGHVEYLHTLKSVDPTLPWPLDIPSPLFSFDSATVCMSVSTTYHSDAFSGAEGYVKYRGRIFFLVYPVDDLKDYFERREGLGVGDLFKYREIPSDARRDPPTWIYTKQQGVWYLWMELPNGF